MEEIDIGKLIKEAREESNFSQDHLGELVGLDQRSISLLEKNKRRLTIQELPSFAKALNKPLFYFLGQDMQSDDWNMALQLEFNRVKSPEAQELIIKITQALSEYIQRLDETTKKNE